MGGSAGNEKYNAMPSERKTGNQRNNLGFCMMISRTIKSPATPAYANMGDRNGISPETSTLMKALRLLRLTINKEV